MRKGGGSTDVSPIPSSLIAFKPRQVLLAEQQRRSLAGSTSMAKTRPEGPTQLKPEDESVLTCSVALWLENKGFSKVLKRFISAARIQDDNWKAKAVNLNEIFTKYQEICNGAQEDSKFQEKQEEKVVGSVENNGDTNCTASEEIECKKKKKKNKGDVAVIDIGKTPKGTEMNGKVNKINANGKEEQNNKTSNGEKVCEVTVDQSTKKQKDKKKKKSKLPSESMDIDEKQIDAVPEITETKHKGVLSKRNDSKDDAEVIVESKDKKKKKKKDDLMENGAKVEKKIIKNEATETGVNESMKESKKRKRMASDENENQPGEEVAVEESKPKKTKGLEEGKDGRQNKEENLFAKQINESTNGILFNIGLDNLSERKSARKQRNGSDEPKTVNAFQRVKIEEVKFADERLQDNSYWAKDGADIGYGAKAQEVLGQVKGRDFRHEKTKKKRGSYRGGQIDLHSHSVKFNYSDDE
ncbi:hypothetical protein BUALT_Bualt11G0082200 [Buddleja alternifolia]|uniref:Srp40 C-terminal domain-containing protein n=1 Tax=Buddleja alternifolia TaxID=168488 RepID=A0AAV6WZT6_9LAMI|nr:hypothetical protein BUALT_Bualt11G0082200 [Buddleja alternifolia]